MIEETILIQYHSESNYQYYLIRLKTSRNNVTLKQAVKIKSYEMLLFQAREFLPN